MPELLCVIASYDVDNASLDSPGIESAFWNKCVQHEQSQQE